jgi:hypothetical protein
MAGAYARIAADASTHDARQKGGVQDKILIEGAFLA